MTTGYKIATIFNGVVFGLSVLSELVTHDLFYLITGVLSGITCIVLLISWDKQ